MKGHFCDPESEVRRCERGECKHFMCEEHMRWDPHEELWVCLHCKPRASGRRPDESSEEEEKEPAGRRPPKKDPDGGRNGGWNGLSG